MYVGMFLCLPYAQIFAYLFAILKIKRNPVLKVRYSYLDANSVQIAQRLDQFADDQSLHSLSYFHVKLSESNCFSEFQTTHWSKLNTL